jgi:hypothetical protein
MSKTLKITDIVKAIEALRRLKNSSMTMLEDPRHVAKLQEEAIIAIVGLELALKGIEVEIKE